MPTSLMLFNYVPGEGSPGYYFPAEVSPAYEGASSATVSLDCNMGTAEFEDLAFRCAGPLPGGWRPDDALNATWPVELKLTGYFYQHLVCAEDADEGSPLWAAFNRGEWTLSVSGPCEGSDCTQETWPAGAECVHGTAISARYIGCDEGNAQCVSDGSQVACERL